MLNSIGGVMFLVKIDVKTATEARYLILVVESVW
jgi:hypothetical protein